MNMNLAPLTWSSFLTTWRLEPGWLVACAVLLTAYLAAWRAAGPRSTVRPWRAGLFAAGCVVLWVTIASAIGAYAMAVFWMHMVLHLVLIMVVPPLLVLGHPLTVLVEGVPIRAQGQVRRWLSSVPVGVLTHPVTGFLVYMATIIGTHLTGFMDQMAEHAWLMTGEQVLYVVAGWMLLLPLIGEEPIRYRPPYLLRLLIVVAAMVPDTIVGIVLLQTSTVPFPVMMAMHPSWAPPALQDIQTGGGLMWAGGDGLMMSIGVGLMLSVITSPTRQKQLLGGWLERARSAALTSSDGAASPDETGPPPSDTDEALEAYNRRLARLHERS
jgi:putative copper resistance protein D